MKIEVTHHVDASEPDEQGMCDYRYEYDLFVFVEANVAVVARSYSDETEEAHFLNIKIDGQLRRLTPSDLRLPVFKQATQYLRQAGKARVRWLSGKGNGYEPVTL